MPGPSYKKGLHSAVYERGNSFIQAAELILEYSHHEIEGKNAIENRKRLTYRLKTLENYWHSLENDKNLNLETLAQLEKILIQEIRKTIYKNTLPRPSFKTVKDELDNAENHVNWKQRNPLIRETGTEAINTTLRKEIPISQFTIEQTEEWLHILAYEEKDQPHWFKSLAPWEKNYFQQRVNHWHENSEHKNLGEFLGPVPTTIRRYPGAPNAYVTSVTIDGLYGYNKFIKIRSGVIVPSKMNAQSQDEKNEKVKITKQNLEQLIIAAIEQKMEAIAEQKDVMPINKPSLPILLQTLYSPPFQPDDAYDNTAMMRALEDLRIELSHSHDSFDIFLEKHGKKPNDIPFSGIDLLYSNRPVNNARGLTWIANLFSQQGRESRNTDSALRSLAEEKLKELKKEEKEDPILKAALESYTKMPYLWNTVFAIKPSRNNPMAEMAALEQIIAGRLGIRIGSCISGKDREEMVTQIAIAQQECFVTYEKFPPPYTATSEEDKRIRAAFVENVARAYLTGHGQALAGENSKGCDGLKNIRDVLGKDICDKIIQLALEDGINLQEFNPIKTSQKVASLNKLTLKRLKKTETTEFKKQWYNAAKRKLEPHISALRIYDENQRFKGHLSKYQKKIKPEKAQSSNLTPRPQRPPF